MATFGVPPTLLGLVERYSPSGQEAGAVHWLVQHMRDLGFQQSEIDGAGNAVGVMGSGPRQVILLGHIDTVPGEIPLSFQEGSFYGRGTVDAKGPLACFVDAVAQVGALTGWQWVVIGAVDEERNSTGARFVLPHYHPDFAIIGEPNRWERVALGYKGSAWAALTVRRSMTHTAAAQTSACETAIAAWLKIQQWGQAFNQGRPRLFDQVLLTLRGMESGEDGLEEWARLKIGGRLPPDLPPEDWYQAVGQAAGSSCIIERLGVAIPAHQCEKNTPLVRAFLSSIRQAGGQPGFVYKTGTADLNIVAPAWGCPALVYGPGDSALDHTPNEHIEIAEYERAVQVLTGALRLLAASVL